ncbi:hypothetical protein GIB67_026142 [Kingdonia uniflora]|uniref:Uncharacterized protein n=1 Tax=Kingdonia uniflora TaxID=39325 RepID=A0A7J7M367_9MAGN|nr:hypothetical protein GIB67_026142 [Kingdonia uniflora]
MVEDETGTSSKSQDGPSSKKTEIERDERRLQLILGGCKTDSHHNSNLVEPTATPRGSNELAELHLLPTPHKSHLTPSSI